MSLPMSYRAHARALMVLALPLIGSNIAQFAVSMVDTIMLGWYDITALAASSLAGSLQFVLFILGGGFGIAVAPLVAEAEEKGDLTQARRVTRMAMWLGIGWGVLMAPLFWWSGPILRAIGQEQVVAELAQQYLRLAILMLIPNLIIMALKSFLSALEHTRVILYSTLGALALNVPLNYALIFGNFGFPEMGLRGAAIASVVITWVSLLWLVIYILRKLPEHEMFARFFKSDWAALRRVAQLGFPIGMTTVAEVGMFAVSSIMAGWIGVVALAAHGIALQCTALTFMGHLGLAQALTVRAGRAFGRHDGVMLRRVAVTGFVIAFIYVLVTMAAFLGLPETLIGVFVDPKDAARDSIVTLGAVLLIYAALFQLVDAGQVHAAGLLRGLQDTRVPMYLAIASYWVLGIPASYVLAFPMGMGAAGLWLGLSIGLAAAAVSLCWRFWGRAVSLGQTQTD